MELNIIISFAFGLHLLIYSIFLIQQGFAFKEKFGYLCELSGLGEIKNPQHRMYNLGYFIFGLLSLVLTYNLSILLSSYPNILTASILLCIADISLCFIALFPRDKFPITHTIFSISLFAGTISSLFYLIAPISLAPQIPNSLIALNIWIIVTLSLYIIIKIKNIMEFGIYDKSMEKLESIWEWIPFMSTLLWSFLMNLVILNNKL